MFDLAIVSMFKDESMIIEEWLDYYIKQGVGHFYLIDNGSTDDYRPKIEKFMNKITLVVDPYHTHDRIDEQVKIYDGEKYKLTKQTTSNQRLLANRHFLESVREECNWVMYIDTDEYIYAPKSKSLVDYVRRIDADERYSTVTDIVAIWRIFGSNGLVKQPESIIGSFTTRKSYAAFAERYTKELTGAAKAITKVKHVNQLDIHESRFNLPRRRLMPDGSIAESRADLEAFMVRFDPQEASIWCNHYMIMSKEYFDKYKRPRLNSGINSYNYIKVVDADKYWQKCNCDEEEDTDLKTYLADGPQCSTPTGD